MESLVETSESRQLHLVQTFNIFYFYIEIAYIETCEIESCHFKQQLVFRYRVGVVHQKELEIDISVWRELHLFNAVAIVQDIGAIVPDITKVEFTVADFLSSLYAIDNHSCHFADATLWKLLNNSLHFVYATIHIALVKLAQSTDKQELIAVCSHRETLVGNAFIGSNFAKTIVLECFVGRRIKRIFNMFAKLCILFKVWVGKHGRPLALREFCF